MLQRQIEHQWYHSPHWLLLFAPLSWLFRFLSGRRKQQLVAQQQHLPLPVVVVGNISVGGTGKTPVIVALVKALRTQGYTPGVICSGYGGDLEGNALVPAGGQPAKYGDEPVMIAQLAQCPVAVGRDRIASVHLLKNHSSCDLVLSDDGMQHYRMHRDFEIAVIDGARGVGNGWLLPVGPLRETVQRLNDVDWVLINGVNGRNVPFAHQRVDHFHLSPMSWKNVKTGELKAIGELPFTNSVAIAGIGHPQRFFDQLKEFGFEGATLAFPDHYGYSAQDFAKFSGRQILMTEKDAIKCAPFAHSNWWALQVGLDIPPGLLKHLRDCLEARTERGSH